MLQRAAAMRRNPTEPERKLWMELRDRRFAGYKFRRQAVIGNRIVDFFCPAKGLAIELDGDTHDADTDRLRDARMLRASGYRTVRFTNEDVMRNCDGVLTMLADVLAERGNRWAGALHHPPAPSSEEEGEESCLMNAPSSEEEGEQAA
ncbi:endonuclease domain-containing protein [Novosphingobium sp.]|uniref:endonuclease domain-containing protein n=1 Tax=Novosphingobium sp. TaxID=1874826 RepID=UPI0027345DF7|nr:endonuclease domain-containing protein [Novosphingobium sp.]MDP3908011.1 endonuclease domain-containing protein [Novosphingobium sp.]